MLTVPSFLVIETFTLDQLVELDNNEYALTVGARPDLVRDDGSPAQAGDVLSIQSNGAAQTRAEGTEGNFERCVKVAAGLVYRPIGEDGRAWLVPCAFDAPNKS